MGLTSKKRSKSSYDDSGSEGDADPDPESEMEITASGTEEEVDDDESESESESGSEDQMEDGDDDGDEEEEEGAEDGEKDAEMEELEKQYQHLRHQEQDLLKNLTRHKDEDAIKGQAVKNQKALWDKTLELRFLLQKAFSSSNKLPQEPVRSAFCNSDSMVEQAYADLMSSSREMLNCMLELQEALLGSNPSIVQGTNGNNKESCEDEMLSVDLKEKRDEDWLQIHRMHCRIAPFRNISVDKWQRKTQVITGAAAFKGKLNAFNQDISEQVSSYMRDPSRLINRMQLQKSSVGVFGKVAEEPESLKEEDGNADGDPDLVDDSEFYQQLLKEFLESCDPTSSETAFYAFKKLQTKKRKIVDRRASKSRKIRYNVHEKIVNFMAPVQMVLPPMAPKLFENLFGVGNQKSTSVM